MQDIFDEESTNDLKLNCFKCGAPLNPGQRFCHQCGCEVIRRDAVFVKAGVIRRTIAEIIDRLVPLPFVVYLFPPWFVVIALYGLLRESTFKSQSIGKKIMGLRVIFLFDESPCAWWQGITRNLLRTLSQLSYIVGILAPLAFLYDVISFIAICRKKGRRPGDYMAGTMVLNEEYHVKHAAGLLKTK